MLQIDPNRKTIDDLFGGKKYTIDFYQREYEWERRHIDELFDDFETRFQSEHKPKNTRKAVEKYPRYFLGTIITSKEEGQNYIVDGQQRLTTLTLLLIHIHHLRKGNSAVPDVSRLIYSESFGEPSFNISVPGRDECLDRLYKKGKFDDSYHEDLSVRNLVSRYRDVQELFPDSLKGDALPYFVDWLINNVDLVEIAAFTNHDAFTIFETMNDRGLNLGQVDMLKGFLLANITDDIQKREEASAKWKNRIDQLRSIESKTKKDHDFFITWLRAKHADSKRSRYSSSAENDFDDISRFHRWVRSKTTQIGLVNSKDFHDFITQNFLQFSIHYLTMLDASSQLNSEFDEMYYNSSLEVQYMLALAPIKLGDSRDIVRKKMKLTAIFLDIYVVRRMVNFKRVGNSTLQDSLFSFFKELRDIETIDLQLQLIDFLSSMEETFEGIFEDSNLLFPQLKDFKGKEFGLTQRNSGHIKYILARITAWIELKTGTPTDFSAYTSTERERPFEIEHILANDFEQHRDEYAGEDEFLRYRNYFGGLVLLPRGTNQSYSDMPYEEKVTHYPKENLLAASLHPKTYENNPNFTNFVHHSGLPFKPHTQFKKADLMERQELYRQICEQIWSPDRLNAI